MVKMPTIRPYRLNSRIHAADVSAHRVSFYTDSLVDMYEDNATLHNSIQLYTTTPKQQTTVIPDLIRYPDAEYENGGLLPDFE